MLKARSCIYVPITQNGKVVDSLGYESAKPFRSRWLFWPPNGLSKELKGANLK